jgi:membrane protease YdiL (CAAX protease family)
MAAYRRDFAGGFADPAPTSLASIRHLRRFLYISIGIGVGMLLQARASSPTPIASRAPLYVGLIAVELALVWFVTIGIRAQRHTFTDLVGRRWRVVRDGVLDVVLAIATAMLLRFSGRMLFWALGGWSSSTGFLLPATRWESGLWILVSVAAGICEELVYRGYLQRQLWALTKSLPVGIVLQSLVFGVGHIYQGWKPALVTAIYGLLLGLVAAWRRSVIPGAIAHAIVDIVNGLKL